MLSSGEVFDLKPTRLGREARGGVEVNDADIENKGLKRTGNDISFTFNRISAFRANELRGVKSFVM